MSEYRKMPVFGKKEPPPSSQQGSCTPASCILVPLMLVLLYVVFVAIGRTTSGMGSTLDKVLCYGALIGFIILMLLGVGQWFRESLAADDEKQEWLKGCRSAEVAIVGRHPSGSYEDEYGIPHSVRASLELAMCADQLAAAHFGTTVRIDTFDYRLEGLKNRSATRIYYRPEAPFTFLIENEI